MRQRNQASYLHSLLITFDHCWLWDGLGQVGDDVRGGPVELHAVPRQDARPQPEQVGPHTERERDGEREMERWREREREIVGLRRCSPPGRGRGMNLHEPGLRT